MSSSRPAGLALALFTAGGLAAAPAQAQAKLYLGQSGNAGLSGVATITGSGTTASGTYQFTLYDTPAPFDPTLTTYSQLYEYGSSAATLGSSGRISDFLFLHDTSTLSVTGGTASATLLCYDSSTVNLSSGYAAYIEAFNNSTVNISGGTVSQSLYTRDNGTMNLFGTGFTETVVDAEPTYTGYEIKENLQNGTFIDNTYFDYGGKLSFNSPAAVPEASSVVSLGVLLTLGFGGLLLSARRRKTMLAG